jgi:UDP-N-acetylglucosamine 2-epimerase (non-hydrolysing)
MSGGSFQHGGMLIVVCTRPGTIKLAPLIIALRQRAVLPVTVCATGQHRELLDGALVDFGLVADIDPDLMQPGQQPEAVVAATLLALASVIAATLPAAVIVQGNTASAYAGAQAGASAQIPVVYVEAGLRSGDIAESFPEELHRCFIGTHPVKAADFFRSAQAACASTTIEVAGCQFHGSSSARRS